MYDLGYKHNICVGIRHICNRLSIGHKDDRNDIDDIDGMDDIVDGVHLHDIDDANANDV